MKILNRAKSICSDEYFISQDIKFELEVMYLRVNGVWIECEESTRSINFEDMLDSQGTKIFASLSKDGKGGDIVRMESELENYTAEFTSNGISFYEYLDNKTKNGTKFKIFSIRDIKIIGIKQ